MDIARLPKNLVVLYEPRDTHRRGPKPALSLDGVIAAAVEIADAEGLAGSPWPRSRSGSASPRCRCIGM